MPKAYLILLLSGFIATLLIEEARNQGRRIPGRWSRGCQGITLAAAIMLGLACFLPDPLALVAVFNLTALAALQRSRLIRLSDGTLLVDGWFGTRSYRVRGRFRVQIRTSRQDDDFGEKGSPVVQIWSDDTNIVDCRSYRKFDELVEALGALGATIEGDLMSAKKDWQRERAVLLCCTLFFLLSTIGIAVSHLLGWLVMPGFG